MADIVIYTKDYCSYCLSAKALLEKKGVSYKEIAVDKDAGQFDEMMKKSGGRRTVPQIFINDQGIGGFDELYNLNKSGQLDILLAQ